MNVNHSPFDEEHPTKKKIETQRFSNQFVFVIFFFCLECSGKKKKSCFPEIVIIIVIFLFSPLLFMHFAVFHKVLSSSARLCLILLVVCVPLGPFSTMCYSGQHVFLFIYHACTFLFFFCFFCSIFFEVPAKILCIDWCRTQCGSLDVLGLLRSIHHIITFHATSIMHYPHSRVSEGIPPGFSYNRAPSPSLFLSLSLLLSVRAWMKKIQNISRSSLTGEFKPRSLPTDVVNVR